MEHGFTFRYNFDHMRNDRWKTRDMEQLFARKWMLSMLICYRCTAALQTAMMAAALALAMKLSCHLTFVASVAIMVVCSTDFCRNRRNLCLSPEGIEVLITPRN